VPHKPQQHAMYVCDSDFPTPRHIPPQCYAIPGEFLPTLEEIEAWASDTMFYYPSMNLLDGSGRLFSTLLEHIMKASKICDTYVLTKIYFCQVILLETRRRPFTSFYSENLTKLSHRKIRSAKPYVLQLYTVSGAESSLSPGTFIAQTIRLRSCTRPTSRHYTTGHHRLRDLPPIRSPAPRIRLKGTWQGQHGTDMDLLVALAPHVSRDNGLLVPRKAGA
jgi:hypothetical protein